MNPFKYNLIETVRLSKKYKGKIRCLKYSRIVIDKTAAIKLKNKLIIGKKIRNQN